MEPEEILNDNGFFELLHGVRDEHGEPGIQKQVWDFVLQAMKEYAAQEAAGFAEWITRKGYIEDPYTEHKWRCNGYSYSTSDLYAIYKKGGEVVDVSS